MDEQRTTMRRLPVYLLLDCSGSMAGQSIAAMETGLRSLVAELQDDPQSLETVWLSVITFDSTAEKLVPLTDIHDFKAPALRASGATAFGEAMEILQESLDEDLRPNTDEHKGDWKPMGFIFTDGEPNDEWTETTRAVRASGRIMLIACGAGPEVNEESLKQMGDMVIRLQDTQPGTLSSFMNWVTQAVNQRSKSVGTGITDSESLPALPPDEGVLLID